MKNLQFHKIHTSEKLTDPTVRFSITPTYTMPLTFEMEQLSWLVDNHSDFLMRCIEERDAWINSDKERWLICIDKLTNDIKRIGPSFKAQFGFKQYTRVLRNCGITYGEEHLHFNKR